MTEIMFSYAGFNTFSAMLFKNVLMVGFEKS